jgi:hypothetical protein
MKLPTDDKERAKFGLWNFYYGYFPNAQLALAKHSYDSNMKHNGEPGATWAKDKSVGSFDRIMRHMVDFEDNYAELGHCDETEKELRSQVWRSMEMLERYICKMEPFNQEVNVHFRMPDDTEDFMDWLSGEGLGLHDGVIYDHEGDSLSQEDAQQAIKEYHESKAKTNLPASNLNRGSRIKNKPMSFEEWKLHKGWRYCAAGMYRRNLGRQRHAPNEVLRLYAQYLETFADNNRQLPSDGSDA